MFDQITLSNGLRIVGEKLSHVRSCTVGAWVKVGSVNEQKNENGLSHFIEHLVFKGTTTRTAKQIASEMDAVGGQLNAFTSKECTCYYAKVIDEDLTLAVDIISDIVINPVFDEVELAKERGVVLEEIAIVEDTPDDLVHELLSEVQYNGSLQSPILGTPDLLKSYTSETVRDYWKKYYVANNTVIAIAGNYDWEAFVGLVEKYFSAYRTSDNLLQTPPQQICNGTIHRNKNVEQVHICLGFKGVPAASDAQFDMAILNNALGGGMSSRLFQRIREELGMAYSVFSYLSAYQTIGSLIVYVGTSQENAETVLNELKTELLRFANEGLTEEEFLSAKAQLRSGYVMGLESSSGRMQALGRSLLLHNRLRTPEEVLAKIDAVTLDSVHALARECLLSQPSVAMVGNDVASIRGVTWTN